MELHKYDLLCHSTQFFERNDDFLYLLLDLDRIPVDDLLASIQFQINIIMKM